MRLLLVFFLNPKQLLKHQKVNSEISDRCCGNQFSYENRKYKMSMSLHFRKVHTMNLACKHSKNYNSLDNKIILDI